VPPVVVPESVTKGTFSPFSVYAFGCPTLLLMDWRGYSTYYQPVRPAIALPENFRRLFQTTSLKNQQP